MNIIDIIIIGILCFSLVSGMYKGFLTSTLALIGFVGSWFGAFKAYGLISSAVQNSTLITGSLQGIFNATDLFTSKELAAEMVGNVSVDMAANGINIPLIGDLFKSNFLQVKAGELAASTTLADCLSQTIVTAAINVLSFVVAFIVIYFAVLLLVNLINNVFRFPQLKHLDWMAGGVFGLLRGVAIIYLIFAVLPMVLSTLSSMDVTFLSDMITQSKFASFFTNSNFLTGLIEQVM